MGLSSPKRLFDFSDVLLYVITTPPAEGADAEEHYRGQVEAACAGGADAVQLRDKSLGAKTLIALCKELQSICDKTGTLFLLNDRVDVALAAGVDGVHVGQEDIPVRWARQMLGHRKIIGCSTHSVAQALAAHGDGADYVSCGPVFATPTKPDYTPVGLDLVKQYVSMVRIPFVAIGGIDLSNVDSVIKAGADRAAFVRAVAGAKDVRQAARMYKENIVRARRERTEAAVVARI